MKKWQVIFLLFLIIGTFFIARKSHRDNYAPFQSNEGMIFGTVFHAKYQYKEDLLQEIMRELNAVDASLSMFNPNSCISKINKGETDEADSLLARVFQLAQAISKVTDGAFDVTVAPLVNAWGFGFKNDVLPDSAIIDSLMSFVGWEKVRIQEMHIQKDDPRIIMDFSAIAKGYGADQVAKLMKQKGIENYMIEIGGEIVCGGKNQNNENWKIGINKPTDDPTSTNQELDKILNLTDCAMATSGNYRNFYVKDGKRIAHTIDPKSGYPVQHSVLSSTVLAPSCAMADGFATSFMVMGLEKAQQILDQHPELQAYLIYEENGEHKVYYTKELEKCF
ncbi:MAG: FAD:protein FMN transferase [Bacteroidaceae bacterium]|nr:FAD:protein FMN transferase [Bacteroidaceae bacterium]